MRLVIYDKTQGFLSWAWKIGALFLKMFGRSDQVVGVDSWAGFFEACQAAVEEKDSNGTRHMLSRIEYWGHGHKGGVSCNGVRMDNPSKRLMELAPHMTPGALLWWRTCSAFSTKKGHQFARSCRDALGSCRVAGHTYITWVWQSGLHVLGPGEEPDWRLDEGIGRMEKSKWSWPWSKSTIFMMSKGPK